MAVEQEFEILNNGDNFMAWEYLRQLIDDGQPMPDWAARYFLKVADAMKDFDPYEDDATDLLAAMEVKYSPPSPEKTSKAKVDYDDIYWCISKWLMEGRTTGVSISDCVRRYIDERERPNREPLDFETVRSAYNTARVERAEIVEQTRDV